MGNLKIASSGVLKPGLAVIGSLLGAEGEISSPGEQVDSYRWNLGFGLVNVP